MLQGFNHFTLAISSLPKSIDFYCHILGFRLRAQWNEGAYLNLHSLWLCLSLDSPSNRTDYTHYAFTIDAPLMSAFRLRLKQFNICEWKNNTSEGESIYFLDPDGHKLEVHCGTLESRLNDCKLNPYEGMIFFD